MDTGYYDLDYSLGNNLGQYNIGANEANSNPFVVLSEDTGYIHIVKIDTVKKIIVGNFEFQCTEYYGNKKKKITEGRFDIKYR